MKWFSESTFFWKDLSIIGLLKIMNSSILQRIWVWGWGRTLDALLILMAISVPFLFPLLEFFGQSFPVVLVDCSDIYCWDAGRCIFPLADCRWAWEKTPGRPGVTLSSCIMSLTDCYLHFTNRKLECIFINISQSKSGTEPLIPTPGYSASHWNLAEWWRGMIIAEIPR